MKSRKIIITLPALILVTLIGTIYLFVNAYPGYLVLYCALLTVLVFLSAKQSLEVHATLNWGFEDFDNNDMAEVAGEITRDFAIYTALYSTVFSLFYFGLYWLYVLIF